MKILIALLGLLSSLVHLSAQAQWTDLGVASAWNAACYDSTRDRVVVQNQTQTWLFDGQSWTWVTPSPSPLYVQLVHDARRGLTVAVDGWLGETWEWDGVSWTLLSAVAPPTGAFCYHAGRERVIGLGRSTASSPWELYEFDGHTWFIVPSPNSPPSTIGLVRLVYDIARDKLVSFGPVVSGAYTSQTWEWDPTNGWVQVFAGGPTSLFAASHVYDAARQRHVLVTWPNSISSFGQTWERTTGAWTLQSLSLQPPGPHSGYLVHDSHRSRCILISFVGSTWSYGVANPALYQPHGTGCDGSLGPPTLALAAPWTLPWLGSSLAVTIDHLPINVASLAWGFQDQTFGTVPLPLDLTPIGSPGCFLRVSPDVCTLLIGAGGTVSWNLPIPFATALVGQSFFQQALSLDPGYNALGGVTTNSIVGTIGRL